MAQAPITPFPNLPSPMPFMPGNIVPGLPQSPAEAEKFIKEVMDKDLIEIFKAPSDELKLHMHKCVEKVITSEKFINKIKNKMAKFLKNGESFEEDEDEETEEKHNDHMYHLICCISKYNKEMDEENRNVKEIEKEIKEKIKLSNDESRVLAVLLRNSEYYDMSQMLGMETEEFLEHAFEIAKKLHKHCVEEK